MRIVSRYSLGGISSSPFRLAPKGTKGHELQYLKRDDVNSKEKNLESTMSLNGNKFIFLICNNYCLVNFFGLKFDQNKNGPLTNLHM